LPPFLGLSTLLIAPLILDTMEITWARQSLRMAVPFRTAKATRTDKQTLWVRVAHDGVEGWGEAVAVDTYGQSLDSAEATLPVIQSMLQNHAPWEVEDIVDALTARFPDQLATVAAVDAAIHDWTGKRVGIPTVHLLGLNPARVPTTSYTLGIDEPEQIRERLHAAADYPILKLKLGSPHDVQTLDLVRQIAPEKGLRIDANTAWTLSDALAWLPKLAEFGVELLEQPLPAGDLDGLRRLAETGLVPIVADESCVRPADVTKVASGVDGINIKLEKCGGIREAMKMIRVARGLGLKIMIGCMIESSLGIAAAAQLAPLADWLDLDGHLLLANDPFTGLGGRMGRLTVGGGPGLGVLPV
jgi:L-alanine-DL-glutamate epimerase-like enolase superfamily enzyme